jgi:hypothetical protein
MKTPAPPAPPRPTPTARRPGARTALAGPALAALALALMVAGCALEPGHSRQGSRQQLGLAEPGEATLRVSGGLAVEGDAVASCGPVATATGHPGFRVEVWPASAPELVVTATLDHPAGETAGDHPAAAALRVTRTAPGGPRTSTGTAELRLDDASPGAGAHRVAAHLHGTFEGAAVSGEVEATIDGCSYLD